MDRTSKPPNQISNNEDSSDSDCHLNSEHILLSGGSNTTSSSSNLQSSTRQIISRNPNPHFLPNTSSSTPRTNSATSNLTPLLPDTIIQQIGSIFSDFQSPSSPPGICNAPSLISSIIFNRFPLSRVSPHGLQDIIRGSLSSAFGGSSSQISQGSTFSDETGQLQNGTDSDFPRQQQYVESVLFMYRLADSLLQGSMSLMIFNDSRLVSQDSISTSDLIRRNHQHDMQLISNRSHWFSITEMQDRHRDMRLDVDNMSYEELLALEDHIGNVSTGLSEDAATKTLKQSKFYLFSEENAQKECCSICQEDYGEEDELGTLICGHGFHICCIKQWLRYKNLCPICKSSCSDTSIYPSFSHTHNPLHS